MAAFNDDELRGAAATITDPALLTALRDGVGLGEWLVAGPELMKKLNDERGLNRALADTVISWYRTGLGQPLDRADTLRLGLHPKGKGTWHDVACQALVLRRGYRVLYSGATTVWPRIGQAHAAGAADLRAPVRAGHVPEVLDAP